MSKLRKRMIEDMNLAGLSPHTQREYIRAVRQLAERYRISPDKISEEQVRQYFVDLYKSVARGAFVVKYYGIMFFYHNTLCVNWNLLSKKNPQAPAEAFASHYKS